MILEAAYVRRLEFESKIQAIAIAQTLFGTGKSEGITSEGKMFKRVSTEAGLARMGVDL